MIGRTNALTKGGGGGDGSPIMYSGLWQWDTDANGTTIVRLLSSGNLIFTKSFALDVFICGGGGSGAAMSANPDRASGAGGGYTRTERVTCQEGVVYPIVVGAGGASANASGYGSQGGNSSAFGYTANGGAGGRYGGSTVSIGGNGGSAGQGVGSSTPSGYKGGTDGGSATGQNSGTGQGSTTRMFGEGNQQLFGGGGGAVRYNDGYQIGGAGDETATAGNSTADALPNRGGGTGAIMGSSAIRSGKGGSGVVILRSPEFINPFA